LIIQTIFSTPGIKQPSSGDLSNDDLVAKWKEIARERTHLYETIESLKKSLAKQEKLNENEQLAFKKLESQIENSEVSYYLIIY
jgi:site-specific DNA-adenine methylase